MEEIPVEIWERIIWCVNHISEVSKLFYTIARKVERPASSLEELKHYVDCNYIRGICLSTELVEHQVCNIFTHSCKIKNREAALYFKEFIHDTYHVLNELYNFDDITIIQNPESYMAALYGAEKIVKQLPYRAENYICLYSKLHNVEQLKKYKSFSRAVVHNACMYNLSEVFEWVNNHQESIYWNLALRFESVDVLKYFDRVDMNEMLKVAVEYSSIVCIKWLLKQGVKFTDEHRELATNEEVIKIMLENGITFTKEHLYKLCYDDYEAAVFLLNTIPHDKEEIAKLLFNNMSYELAYRIFPCDEYKLYMACLNEDLETVRELYPSYDKSLFEKFQGKSYKLLEILHREETSMNYFYTPDSIMFQYNKGMMDASALLDNYLRCHGNSIKVVKFLLDKGAVTKRVSEVPRVRKAMKR